MLPRRTLAALLPVLLLPGPAHADPAFDAFLADVRADSLREGVAPATVDRAFAGLRSNPKVLELDGHQPEKTQSWERYSASRISDARIAAGRKAMAAVAPGLAAIERRYGVDPGILVAIWGVETNYGGYTGGFSVIEALATLAAAGRHDGFFRTELLAALRILDHGDITPRRMTGSYAGAMGQPQFMPSSYLDYAVDFDGTGRRDIWDSRTDALASIANYLLLKGRWRRGEPWGQPVQAPPSLASAGREDRRSLAEWSRLGVTRADGTPLTHPEAQGALLQPDGPAGQAFMAYPNFEAIRLYNPSDLYALSVGILADRIVA